MDRCVLVMPPQSLSTSSRFSPYLSSPWSCSSVLKEGRYVLIHPIYSTRAPWSQNNGEEYL